MSADITDPSIVSIVESPVKRLSPNPNGRPKGSTNRNTATMRYLLEQIMVAELPYVHDALRTIRDGKPPLYDATTGVMLMKGVAPNPMGYVNAMQGLADFSLPRLSRVEVKVDAESTDDITIAASATPEEAQAAYLRLTQG